MRRVSLAMTLGFGLALVGCGETAPPADEAAKAANPDGNAKTPPGDLPPKVEADIKDDGPGSSGGLVPGYTAPPGTTGPGDKSLAKPAPADPNAKGEAKTGEAPAAEPKKDDAPAAEPKKDDAPAAEPKKDEKDDTPKVVSVVLSAEEIAAIKKLPDADQKAALAQKVCPVGEDEDGKSNHLGAMGKPIKKEIKGKTVYLCCESCIEDIEKNPDKYLAKIAK